MTVTPQLIVECLLAGLVSFALWVIRRWYLSLTAQIKALIKAQNNTQAEVQALKTRSAVSAERFDNLMGGINFMRQSVQETNQATGNLKASVEKIWTVLTIKGIAAPQPSDQSIEKQG